MKNNFPLPVDPFDELCRVGKVFAVVDWLKAGRPALPQNPKRKLSAAIFRRNICCVWFAVSLFVLGALTAPAAEPFVFIQVSDTQFGMFADNSNFVQESANCDFAVATINRLHPAFVVVTGDLVNKPGDAAQIAEYKRIFGKIDATIPVYNVAGNHDVGNIPTPATIAAYTREFGPDHYSFRHGDFVGIVLDSNLIQAPQQTTELAATQERWLKSELEHAKSENARNIVVFQHHPWFLDTANETNQYFNLPRESREKYLPLFHEFGVKHVFCGHYHRNNIASDGDLEVVASAPAGKPLGKDGSGIRIVIVRDDHIENRYYDFGQIPVRIDIPKISGPVAHP